MRERHNWSTGKHPKTCTCSVCTQRRAEAGVPRPKKKRKPKSQRGKANKKGGDKSGGASGALAEAMDILNRSQDSPDTASDTSEGGKSDE